MRVMVLGALAACGFESHTPAPDEGVPQTLTDDAREDFANPAEQHEVTLHARGGIEPAAYTRERLQMDGFKAAFVQQEDLVSWAQLEAMTATGRSGTALSGSLDANFGDGSPFGVGLVATVNNFTLVWRGEIYLPGPTTFELASDGPALLELSTDGTFNHRMYARTAAPVLTPRVNVAPPVAGWYPIRAAFTDTIGPAFIQFREVVNGVVTPIDRARFRTPIAAQSGLVMEAFDEATLVDWAEEAHSVTDLSFDFGSTALPYDFALSGNFALRLIGQIWIETPGDYTFAAKTADRARVWIDRQVVATSSWPRTPDGTTPILRAQGWHDLVVDYADLARPASFNVIVASAPTGVATGIIPASQLRPVTRFGRIASTSLIGSTIAITESMRATYNMPAFAPPIPVDATVDLVDVSYLINHSAPIEVTTSVVHGDGTGDTLRANDADTTNSDYFGTRANFTGKPMGNSWKVTALDEMSGNGSGTLSSPAIAVAYRRAVGPFAETASFTSRARPTPGAIALDAIRIEGTIPPSASITAELRACASEETCDAAGWQAASAEMPPLAGGEFVQYRLTIACDTYDAPDIDKVVIDYRTAE